MNWVGLVTHNQAKAETISRTRLIHVIILLCIFASSVLVLDSTQVEVGLCVAAWLMKQGAK